MATADGYSVWHWMEAGLSLKRCRDFKSKLGFVQGWGWSLGFGVSSCITSSL